MMRPFSASRRALLEALLLATMVCVCLPKASADLDINAVAGQVTIDGSAAPSGTVIRVTDGTVGVAVTTQVDGPNVPSFLRGEGRYDTGDVGQFNTGDRVTVTLVEASLRGEASATLSPGTTTINLAASRNQPPFVDHLPRQQGFEDVQWELDLEPYLSDPDTPVASLVVTVQNPNVRVSGHTLIFLYPEGVVQDRVLVYISDGASTVSRQIEVTIVAVNDPPHLAELPALSLVQGSEARFDLLEYTVDPDDELDSLVWTTGQSDIVGASTDGSVLTVVAPESAYGVDLLLVRVSDPGGLSHERELHVEVAANVTALIESYEGEISQLRLQVSDLEDDLESLEAENADLSAELGHLLDQISVLEEEHQNTRLRLMEAQAEASALAAKLAELEVIGRADAEVISRLNSERANLTAQIGRLRAETESTQTYYTSVITKLEARKKEIEAEAEDLSSLVTALRESLNVVLENESIAQEEVHNLTVEQEMLLSQLGEAQARLANVEQLAIGLEENLTAARAAKAEADEDLQELLARLDEIEEENSRLELMLQELSDMSPPQNAPATPGDDKQQTSSVDSLLEMALSAILSGRTATAEGFGNSLLLVILSTLTLGWGLAIASRTQWLRTKMSTAGQEVRPNIWQRFDRRRLYHMSKSNAGTSQEATGTHMVGLFHRPTKIDADAGRTTQVVTETAQRDASPIDGKSKSGRDTATDAGTTPVRSLPEKQEILARISGWAISKADRDYIESLVGLGYVEEARVEIARILAEIRAAAHVEEDQT